ncbi:hypothetical protein Tco_1405928 [Tanacetum coccineum]
MSINILSFAKYLQGNAIQANMGKADIAYFSSLLLDGAAYRITKFICNPTINYNQTLQNGTTLRFGKYTSFESIPADAFPKHHFNLVPYNQLNNKLLQPDTTTTPKQPTLTGSSATETPPHIMIGTPVETIAKEPTTLLPSSVSVTTCISDTPTTATLPQHITEIPIAISAVTSDVPPKVTEPSPLTTEADPENPSATTVTSAKQTKRTLFTDEASGHKKKKAD